VGSGAFFFELVLGRWAALGSYSVEVEEEEEEEAKPHKHTKITSIRVLPPHIHSVTEVQLGWALFLLLLWLPKVRPKSVSLV